MAIDMTLRRSLRIQQTPSKYSTSRDPFTEDSPITPRRRNRRKNTSDPDATPMPISPSQSKKAYKTLFPSKTPATRRSLVEEPVLDESDQSNLFIWIWRFFSFLSVLFFKVFNYLARLKQIKNIPRLTFMAVVKGISLLAFVLLWVFQRVATFPKRMGERSRLGFGLVGVFLFLAFLYSTRNIQVEVDVGPTKPDIVVQVDEIDKVEIPSGELFNMDQVNERFKNIENALNQIQDKSTTQSTHLQNGLSQLQTELESFHIRLKELVDLKIESKKELEKSQRDEIVKFLERELPKYTLARLDGDKVVISPIFYRYLVDNFGTSQSNQMSNKELENVIHTLEQVDQKIITKNEILSLMKKEITSYIGTWEEKNYEMTLNKVMTEIEALKSKETNSDSLNEVMMQIVDSALEKYSADKLGLADYALASRGTKIVEKLTSPSFQEPKSFLASLFQIGTFGKPAITALTADTSLGNCWSFSGSQGKLTIDLGHEVALNMFTLDHVPKSLALDASSAPKEVQLWILKGPTEKDAKYIGTWHFLENPIQTFKFENQLARFVQLRIMSNQGHPKYTCLYRFRLHSNL